MAVNIPNPGSYLAQLGQDLVNFRLALDALIKDATYVNAMGGAAFFEAAPFNMDTADATALASVIGSVTATNPTVEAIEAFITSAVPFTAGG